MTDLSPDVQGLLDEPYESDLTEEESEKLLLMCGHGIGPKLSSAAQKITWAVGSKFTRKIIAAALRTAAEQIEDQYCDSDIDDSDGAVFVLRRLMLLADELEAAK